MRILDCHTHMPSPTAAGAKDFFKTVEDAVGYLRKAGTHGAVFNTWQGVFAANEADLNAGNADALRLAREYDGFLYPGVVIHPKFPAASRDWLKRFRDQGYPWVGELVAYNNESCNYGEKSFLDLFEDCARNGHIVQLHTHVDIVEVARRFPEMPVVNSHIPMEECPKFAALPNIWMDISGYIGGLTIGGIEAAYKAFGAGRLLYGTDFTGYDPRCYTVRLESVVSDPAERESMYAGNLLRLLGKNGWPERV